MVWYCANEKTVSGDGAGDRIPYTLDVRTGDGTWLNVVEEFAQLPATRSVVFWTTEVWRPVGVYVCREFAGELRLHEPRGYDGGLRTAVSVVVVSVHVYVDLNVLLGVECTLFGPSVVAGGRFGEEE